jgi:hypothetical protein
MLKIDKGIPVKLRARPNELIDTIMSMERGDSVFFPDGNGAPAFIRRAYLMGAFVVRRKVEGGVRIWLLDPPAVKLMEAGKTIAQQAKVNIPQTCPDCGKSDMQRDGDGHPKCSNCGRTFA